MTLRQKRNQIFKWIDTLCWLDKLQKGKKKKEIALRSKQKNIINMMDPFTENDGFWSSE